MAGWDLFSQSTVLFISLFVMMVGLIMTAVPPLPGTLIIWLAAGFYGLALGWERLGWLTFSLLTVLMIVGMVVDIVAGHFGAKLGGASCLAITIGAILGFLLGIVFSLIGTPILGCLAGLIGMVLGVLWIEWRRNNDWQRAVNATKGYVVGTAAGVIAKVISGVLMFGVFLLRVYWIG